MSNKITPVSNKPMNIFSSFKTSNQVKKGYRSYRYHNTEPPTKTSKYKAITGAVIGTALPMCYFSRKQNGKINSIKKLFNIDYKLPEISMIASGSIIGGILGGMIGENKNKRKAKINEGVFQFMNTLAPAVMVTGFLELSKKNKFLNKPYTKVCGIMAALASGMFFGAKVSNFITDPKDLYPDRKLGMKDAVANIDDLIGGLVLAKFPLMDKINAEKILPVIYTWCGYRAGQNS